MMVGGSWRGREAGGRKLGAARPCRCMPHMHCSVTVVPATRCILLSLARVQPLAALTRRCLHPRLRALL